MKYTKLTISLLLLLTFSNTDTMSAVNKLNTITALSGKYELIKSRYTDSSGYQLLRKSIKIEAVEFKKSNKKGIGLQVIIGKKVNNIENNNITSANVTGRTTSSDKQNERGPEFDRIDIVEGKYKDIKVEKKSNTQNVYTMTDISFPLRLIMHTGDQLVEFKLTEPGKWIIDVNYLK